MNAAARRGARGVAPLAVALALAAWTGGAPSADWRPREFVVGGYYYSNERDPSSRFDASRLVRLDDAGIRLLVTGYALDSTEARAAVRMTDSLRAARPGFAMKLLVQYERPWNEGIVSHNLNPELRRATLARTLDPAWGINSPSVEGWMLWDEPVDSAQFASIAHMTAQLDQNPVTRDKLPFVNLLPIYASGQPRYQRFGRDPIEAYRRYLAEYRACFERDRRRVPLLCFDHYGFQTGGRRDDYFINLALVAEAARAAQPPGDPPPFWVVAQLSAFRGERGFYPAPDAARLRFQAFAALAYGAKGILWWTLVPSIDGYFGDGALDARGRPAARFAALRELNRSLLDLGPTLVALQPLAVVHQSVAGWRDIADEALGDARRPRGAIADLTGGRGAGMVGVLRNPRTQEVYLLVVNKDLAKARRFQVRLAAAPRAVERIAAGGRPAPVAITGAEFETPSLAAGGGALFRIVR